VQDIKESYQVLMEEFKTNMLKEHGKKQAEHEEFKDVLDTLVNDRDTRARDMVLEFERLKKHTIRGLGENPEQVAEKIKEPLSKLATLRTELMDLESNCSDNLRELNEEFHRNYSVHAEHARNLISAFFASVRTLETQLQDAMRDKAMEVLEQNASDKPDDVKGEYHNLSEQIKAMIADKESFLGAVSGCHEHNTGKIDDLEADLLTNEKDRAEALSQKYRNWARNRNRDRVMEVWSMFERYSKQLEDLVSLEEGS